jgi:RNA polymerase sigma factor (sigma-70 family)
LASAPITLVKMNGIDLLTAYRTRRSEDAFTALVRLYTNLVYSVANRRVSNGALAEEVTQAVFLRLAKTSTPFQDDPSLVAWLHRTTVHVAIDVWRSESRRRAREESAATMEPAPAENNRLWSELSPCLDEALDQLDNDDRQTLLLRFFQQKRMRELGEILGISEDAAKMRVGRALERLRGRLGPVGAACGATLLAGLLGEHAVEAAPSHVVVNVAPAPLASGNGAVALFRGIPLGRLWLPVAATALMVAAFVWLWPHSKPESHTAPILGATTNGGQPGHPPSARSRLPGTAGVMAASETPSPQPARLALQVLDGTTGKGIPQARIQAVYFYAGGVPEGHELRTDDHGEVAVPQPDAEGDRGMNVFVTSRGYVPKCLNWSVRQTTNYTMRLDPALTVGGTVVDEAGRPVGGVKLEVQAHGVRGPGPDHVAFNGGNSEVVSDAQGRWLCPYIPDNLSEIDLLLSREEFATTHVSVRIGTPEATNQALVIKRGFTILGIVRGADGQPIADAEVKELHNYGYEVKRTTTGEDGGFCLKGVLGVEGPRLQMVVSAQGFTPQVKEVALLTATNSVPVVLSAGRVFRGRVTDLDGNPIPNATVRTDADNQGLVKYRWLTHTDAEGYFEWDSAPEEPVLFWFEAPGYQVIRDQLLQADGDEHAIKLARLRP